MGFERKKGLSTTSRLSDKSVPYLFPGRRANKDNRLMDELQAGGHSNRHISHFLPDGGLRMSHSR